MSCRTRVPWRRLIVALPPLLPDRRAQLSDTQVLHKLRDLLKPPGRCPEIVRGHSRLWRSAYAVAFILTGTWNASTGLASDRVVLQPPEKSSPQVLACSIVDYTADEISVQLLDQLEVRRFPAGDVAAVETIQTESHLEGLREFEAGDWVAAERAWERALEDEPRPWVQREVLGWLVKAAVRRQDRGRAGQRFVQIAASESAAREYPLIPLVWGTAEVGTSLRQQARLWLTSGTEVAELLGASVLLFDTAYAEVSEQTLRRLSRSLDRRVAALARSQLWRLRVTASDVSPDELTDWEKSIESLPREMRAGPYFVLGRAWFQQQEYDRAAAAFLWVTTVYSENEELAAEATSLAGRALELRGRANEAKTLYQEVLSKFDWSSAAVHARGRIHELPVSEDADRDG